jgi:hypothetical protein
MPRTAQGRIKINVFVDERVYERLKALAAKRRQPVSELFRDAMEIFVINNADAIERDAETLEKALTR